VEDGHPTDNPKSVGCRLVRDYLVPRGSGRAAGRVHRGAQRLVLQGRVRDHSIL